ncbi:ATP-binding protein [Bartonella sp. HY406]|uniref:ATP-binding protein n=1 Tax=Bartonella sp. HY406 TaxID=2979331 RepID=UPI0021C78648|nr:AAA family ATPase [Bartonella sp. HY406]UXN03582.1 AAA family ATPase [Bartonella sp. HY406]
MQDNIINKQEQPQNTANLWDDAYEYYMIGYYFLRILHGTKKRNKYVINQEILNWYEEYHLILGLSIPEFNRMVKLEEGSLSIDDFRLTLTPSIFQQKQPVPRLSNLQKRLDILADILKLDGDEVAVINAVYRFVRFLPLMKMISAFDDNSWLRSEPDFKHLSDVLGKNIMQMRELLRDDSNLIQMGLIKDRHGDSCTVSELLIKIVEGESFEMDELCNQLVGLQTKPTLSLSDYDFLAQDCDDAIRILSGSLDKGAKGVGILLYGAPGTGKTEFAKLLAEHSDARAAFIGEASDDNKTDPSRYERLVHLSLLSALGKKAGRVVAIVDEADDIFAGIDNYDPRGRAGSKVFMNRLVESSEIPVVWIVNDLEKLGETILRRMLRIIEFPKPAKVIRERIITQEAEKNGVRLDSESFEILSKIPAAPALFASGLRAAALGGGDGRMAVSAVHSVFKALGGEVPHALDKDKAQAKNFEIELANSNADLKQLVEKIVHLGPKPLSFLFMGASGTGKSLFARHLADRLGMKVAHKRASDILSMWVGGSEENIANIFKQVAENNEFLIIDEADSLLFNREGAIRSWEVSQVNEMLTWMESHPLPFAVTTNLVERLDPAVFRRFLFKIEFLPLNYDQIQFAFKRYFKSDAPDSVLGLTQLTIGDFAVVARKCDILAVEDIEAIAQMLKTEIEMKKEASIQSLLLMNGT